MRVGPLTIWPLADRLLMSASGTHSLRSASPRSDGGPCARLSRHGTDSGRCRRSRWMAGTRRGTAGGGRHPVPSSTLRAAACSGASPGSIRPDGISPSPGAGDVVVPPRQQCPPGGVGDDGRGVLTLRMSMTSRFARSPGAGHSGRVKSWGRSGVAGVLTVMGLRVLSSSGGSRSVSPTGSGRLTPGRIGISHRARGRRQGRSGPAARPSPGPVSVPGDRGRRGRHDRRQRVVQR